MIVRSRQAQHLGKVTTANVRSDGDTEPLIQHLGFVGRERLGQGPENVIVVGACLLDDRRMQRPIRNSHTIQLAHQLRDLQYAIAGQRGAAQTWAQAFQARLRAAVHLRHRQDAEQEAFGGAAAAGIAAACAVLLAETLPAGWRRDLQRRYQRQRQALFVFLYAPAVPPTNTASARSPRPSVVQRKVTGGFRSEAGATAYAILRTVADTVSMITVICREPDQVTLPAA